MMAVLLVGCSLNLHRTEPSYLGICQRPKQRLKRQHQALFVIRYMDLLPGHENDVHEELGKNP